MDKGEAEQIVSHQDLSEDYQKPLQTCKNKCFCKKCCYHCQLCFLQKGLGVTYHAPRTRRKKIRSLNLAPLQHQSISTKWGRDGQTTPTSQEKVETTAGSN
uniref:Protein Tat n=1 Tax=Simian immunodeficiency virus agm.vervet (isolate AGM TYO-1) TaxID=11731 RepID=TAT_SIVVT|nr:RecName: Full=Protein Tat; AltName: Full=Transactivating regulatory protein [Simian immunodeficiency virus (TYO-1 ISOLATE)]pir/TNLJG4/ trans-activating transcription regulator - simian immunodeficiency virus (African green monkey isolate) [Simian immunodeficiency virus]CAA30661.1 tat-III [Simian immunodeficiency virus]